MENKTFSRYLFEKGFLPRTITEHDNNIKSLGVILMALEIVLIDATYNDLIDVMEMLQKNGVSPDRINKYLKSLAYYFDYLIEEKQRSTNPAYGLRVNAPKKKYLENLLATEQIEKLYEGYKVESTSEINRLRNKLLLGFVCFQAMRINEIGNIKRSDIDLRKAEIYIRMTVKSESRTLKLQPQQVLDIYEYLLKTNGTEVKENDKLIQYDKMSYLFQQIKNEFKTEEYSYLKTSDQIRNSVISNWLKVHDLLQVKYMAGHRFVSSTERFSMAEVEELKRKILRVHPMG